MCASADRGARANVSVTDVRSIEFNTSKRQIIV